MTKLKAHPFLITDKISCLEMNVSKINIDANLVKRLIASQFPAFVDLEIKSVELGGWDNYTFHLGDQMLVRLPSAQCYADKVLKEQIWLPKLAPFLPLPIPKPLVMGEPDCGYPWNWSIYNWLDGETASVAKISNMTQFACDLGHFLLALQAVDLKGGPEAGQHNFYRGAPLAVYDDQTRRAIKILENKIDIVAAANIWNEAMSSVLSKDPVWIHGDVASGNLLVKNGYLSAVIDFGGLGIGDPACDLAIAWTFFKSESRREFIKTIGLDQGTVARGRGWALWKALIVCAGLCGAKVCDIEKSWFILDEILTDDDWK